MLFYVGTFLSISAFSLEIGLILIKILDTEIQWYFWKHAQNCLCKKSITILESCKCIPCTFSLFLCLFVLLCFFKTLDSMTANGRVFICKLSGSGFDSSCSHLKFRFRTSFKKGVPWHSSSYRVWIHSDTRTWHDKNIQSNALNRKVLRTQLKHLASLTKSLSGRLRTKWFCVRVQLHSLKLQILCLLQARSSLTFRQL